MNQSLIQLFTIAKKETRTIIGLMSGTSLDGLDIALCTIRGSGTKTDVELTNFKTIPYSEKQKKRLQSISSVESVKLKEICYQHRWLATIHGDMINDALHEWNLSGEQVDCIASHGQTIYHLPARDQRGSDRPLNSTLQIADGDEIAARTGIVTISDFRQKHIAHGGEGAPMAALVDRLLFGESPENRILLNIGGIANYTWLPAAGEGNHTSFTTDTGPGNTLIDNVVQHFYDRPYDEDGAIARSGVVREELLNHLLQDDWFRDAESKSTGPEYFNIRWVEEVMAQNGMSLDSMPPEDLVATVTELSARTIAESLETQLPALQNCDIYTSGGGAHNPVLMDRLSVLLNQNRFKSFAELGIDPDAKEAVVFAVLANEMLAGDGIQIDSSPGSKNINFGKISFPS